MHSRLSTLGVQSLSWVYLSPCSHASADSRMRMLMLQEQHGEGTSSFGGRRNQTFQWPAILKKKCCHVKASWNPACILPTAARWKSEGVAVENKPVGKAPPKGQTGNFKHTFKSFPFSPPIWFFSRNCLKRAGLQGLHHISKSLVFIFSLCPFSDKGARHKKHLARDDRSSGETGETGECWESLWVTLKMSQLQKCP